jgi:hypothetical protein
MTGGMESVRESVVNLLSGVVDYAGLFPPARLDMRPTCMNYAQYLQSDLEWMLGRLIVPVARLDEFEQASADLLSKDEETADVWYISALVGDDLASDFERIFQFNERHAPPEQAGEGASNGLAVIDAIETKADTTDRVDAILETLPEEIDAFIEIPWDADPRGLVASIGGDTSSGAGAKIRTGHVNPQLIPPIENLARFIDTCAQAGVPFKATAGLHHPIRAEYKLTYEPDAATATMHGYLNVFIASALAHAKRISREEIEAVLAETDPSSFTFNDESIRWRDHELTSDQIVAARERFAGSFGSCSFDEPTGELDDLGLMS